jgi:hypothetical protein
MMSFNGRQFWHKIEAANDIPATSGVNNPTLSSDGDTGIIPSVEIRPKLGLKPTITLCLGHSYDLVSSHCLRFMNGKKNAIVGLNQFPTITGCSLTIRLLLTILHLKQLQIVRETPADAIC